MLHHMFKSYIDIQLIAIYSWGFVNRWILQRGGVSSERVCYQRETNLVLRDISWLKLNLLMAIILLVNMLLANSGPG